MDKIRQEPFDIIYNDKKVQVTPCTDCSNMTYYIDLPEGEVELEYHIEDSEEIWKEKTEINPKEQGILDVLLRSISYKF